MSIELDATLALTAKLQAAEKRALVAETALELARRQMEAETPGMVVTAGKLDLTAARELMRKAGEAETLRTERDEAQQRLRAAIQERMKTFSERPDFKTFVELKHGVVGTILQALQDGIISRGKACEALAEVAHGAEPTFKASDVEPLDEDCLPAQELRKLRTERDGLAALLHWWFDESNEDARESIRVKRMASAAPWTAEQWIEAVRKAAKEATDV